MRATWYELEDGNVVDPSECAPDEAGNLVHKSGVKVAMRFPDCAMSREVDVDVATATGDQPPRRKRDPKDPATDAIKDAKSEDKDMKPEDQSQGYKTREAKPD